MTGKYAEGMAFARIPLHYNAIQLKRVVLNSIITGWAGKSKVSSMNKARSHWFGQGVTRNGA